MPHKKTTTPPLSKDFVSVGADLVLHQPTNLVFKTNGDKLLSVINPLELPEESLQESELLEECSNLSLYENFQPRSRSNYITVAYDESLASLLRPTKLEVCGGCGVFCYKSSEAVDGKPPQHWYMRSECVQVPSKKFKGYVIQRRRALMVVLDEDYTPGEAEAGDHEPMDDDPVNDEPMDDEVSDSLEYSDSEADVEEDFEDDATADIYKKDFQEIGTDIYLHHPTNLFLKKHRDNSYRIYDPYFSKHFLNVAIVYKQFRDLSPEKEWGSFYYHIPEPLKRNYVVAYPDESLLSVVPVYRLAICDKCQRHCAVWPSDTRLSESTYVKKHLKECQSKTPAYRSCLGIPSNRTNPGTFMVFDKDDLEALDGLIPGILGDCNYEVVPVRIRGM